MREALEDAKRLVTRVVADLDPDTIDTTTAAQLVVSFAELERLCVAGKTLAARRAAQGNAWRAHGDRTAERWLARATGESVTNAADTLATSTQLEELPDVDEAMRAGRLSAAQAKEIAAAATADPASVQRLLDAAATESLAGLREEARRVKAAAADAENQAQRRARLHASRSFRTWNDPDGAFRGEFRLTPEAGATLTAALKPFRQAAFDQARRAGRHEAPHAYDADALLAMAEHATTNGSNADGRAPTAATVIVRVDHDAFVRGYTEPGEMCEIPGVGPVHVDVARKAATDGVLWALTHDGCDVHRIVGIGHQIPKSLRLAVLERDDHRCVVPGCGSRHRIELDHWQTDVHKDGPTIADNLAVLCKTHHDDKTYRGWQLTGGPGAWQWRPPVALAT